MSYVLVFTDAYNRRALRWLKKHPDLRSQYLKTLQLLEANPFHPSLRLHALSGKLQGVHSVSINVSYRITLELLIQDEQIIPVNVGDHDAVYERKMSMYTPPNPQDDFSAITGGNGGARQCRLLNEAIRTNISPL